MAARWEEAGLRCESQALDHLTDRGLGRSSHKLAMLAAWRERHAAMETTEAQGHSSPLPVPLGQVCAKARHMRSADLAQVRGRIGRKLVKDVVTWKGQRPGS